MVRWSCSVCDKTYVSVFRRRPINFWSALPMPLPIGAMHSAKLHRVCSLACREVIIKHERETQTVWGEEE